MFWHSSSQMGKLRTSQMFRIPYNFNKNIFIGGRYGAYGAKPLTPSLPFDAQPVAQAGRADNAASRP